MKLEFVFTYASDSADLMRVKGLGEEWSDLLEAAGVDTVQELKHRKPENLHAKMVRERYTCTCTLCLYIYLSSSKFILYYFFGFI